MRLSLSVLGRSSVVSVDAIPRILVDPGSGTVERAGHDRFDLAPLEQVLLTRLGIDSAAGLPALLSHLYVQGRKRPIALTGPAGEPGADEFVRLLFGPAGAWRYLTAFDGFGIAVHETPSTLSELAVYSIPIGPALQELDVSLFGVAIPDGTLPAVAFRVECADESIVFAGGLARPTASFVALAADCGTLAFVGAAEAQSARDIGRKCRAKELVVTDARMVTVLTQM